MRGAEKLVEAMKRRDMHAPVGADSRHAPLHIILP